MKKHTSTKLLSIATLLMLLVLAMPSQAQENNGEGNPSDGDDSAIQSKQTADPASKLTKKNGFYVINGATDYVAFRQLVATGNPYANAILEKDIAVTSAIGTGDIQFHYRGTFDGQGHTIEMKNLTSNTDDKPCGLFQYTEPGCIIKNLKVKGTIASSKAKHIGSLIGCATGTKIENCICTDTIKYDGDGCVGGLVGISYGESFFENCAFIGKIDAPNAKSCYGFVGENVHMVSLKSNYVAAIFKVGSTAKTGQFMNVARENSQTILNNYACHEVISENPDDAKKVVDAPNGFAETVKIKGKDVIAVKSVSPQDVTGGQLCLDLNVKGRNGVVWYQDYGFPYPIKRSSGMVAVKTDNGILTEPECKNHSYNDHICQNCGAIEDDNKIEPLQKSTNVISGKDITIGYLRYRYNKYKGMDTAELLGYSGDINAVHIPETINVDGEVYRVDYVAQEAFKDCKMEYLYIGKNVDNIDDNSFNGCKNLKNIHIADTTIITKMGLDSKDKTMFVFNQELFFDSPLEKLYVGRNLRWNHDSGCDAPFEDRDDLATIMFGPRVTLVGNSETSGNPRAGTNPEPFENCNGIKQVYFMGDDECLKDNNRLLIGCYDGMENAPKYYVNRTFEEKDEFIGYIRMSDTVFGDAIFNDTEEIIYGPYCKKIIDNSFSRANGAIAEPKYVDFTNAFNLEEICDFAFQDCNIAYFKGTFENTKLKRIGKKAFYDCDNLKNIVIPGTVTKIDEAAFKDIDGISMSFKYADAPLKIGEGAFFDNEDSFASIYYGRNLEYENGCPFKAGKELGTIVIAPEITELPEGLFSNIPKLGALTFVPSDAPLTIKGKIGNVFSFSDGITSMYINRKFKDRVDDWGSTITTTLRDLTFGNSVEKVSDNFRQFTNLQTVLFGEKVKTIAENTFQKCKALKTVFAMGDITIENNAFAECTSLSDVFLMGKDLQVGENAFGGCSNIKQVVVGLTKDPESSDGDASAFHDDVYKNANFSCAGDTQHNKVTFKEEPWRSFQTRGTLFVSKDYEYGFSYNEGEYEHARLDHHFDNGKYEMVYLPFEMDSYFFGADAEIYKLDNYATEGGNEDANFLEIMDDNDRYCISNVYFKKQDIAEKKKLYSGIYIVKTEHNIESLESHPNLFEGSTITVMNKAREYGWGAINKSAIVANNYKKALDRDYIFSYREGIIQRNGKDEIPDGIAFYPMSPLNKEYVFNIVDYDRNVIMSSKTDLVFNKFLEGYSSFYDADHTYIAPEWCEIYVVTESNPDGSLVLEKIEDRIIKKGQAVLVKSSTEITDDLTEYLTYTTMETTDPLYNVNMLRGVSVDTPANELSADGFVYVLSCNSNMQNTGFYKLSGDRTMPAGKAYIPPYLVNTADLAKACLFIFNENTITGIEHAAENAGADNSIYDLMGRSLRSAGFKGIYIINGKKVVVK